MEIEEQNHNPLRILSGVFKVFSLNWSLPEKEGFAGVEAMCKLEYLLLGGTVLIYTNHANLAYIYNPCGCNLVMSRYTENKLICCSLKLSEVNYVIEFIQGENWLGGYAHKVESLAQE